MKFDIELVGKVGSMALINRKDNDIDYNIFARIGRELAPGMIWVSSGATEIGRLDFIRRNGAPIEEDAASAKTDYAAQGQAILMQNYRNFINPNYSVRQVLVEHVHFNNEKNAQHLREMLLRCPKQNAIPIINYNDAVCETENMKMEIQEWMEKKGKVVECVDNDETAAQIACLVKSKRLLVLTSAEGIYRDPNDPKTLIKEIGGKDVYEVLSAIEEAKKSCHGASRAGANGAFAKLEYVKDAVKNGTEVFIASSKYSIKNILEGDAPRTRIGIC